MNEDIVLTPMMKQFLDLKAKHPDAVMLFRCGDFYETYSTDAVVAAEILGITLTKRANGKGKTVEMAGFPHHALDTYLPKLVRAGKRVAICDQLEDPKMTKKLVKRGITELVTPGVSINDNILNYRENNFLAAVHFGKGMCGVAFLDISTGEFLTAEGPFDYVDKLLNNFAPKEVLFERGKRGMFEGNFGNKFFTFELDDWVFTETTAREKLLKHFETKNLKGFGVEHLKNGIIASGAILQYLIMTQHTQIGHITSLARIEEDKYVRLDKFTVRSLELIGSMNDGGSSLLNVIDKTISPMGARLLKRWLVFPLKDVLPINERLNVVEYFFRQPDFKELIEEQLHLIGDLERIISKVAVGRVSPREVVALKVALQAIEPIKEACMEADNASLNRIGEQLNICQSVRDRIAKEINNDPPLLINKGGVIKSGVNAELDELRQIAYSGKDYLLQIQQRESELTEIPSLKIGYNNVFGYYIEVRNTHKDKVPQEWIRKQTLANAERYITQELKEYEEKILGAEDKILILETQLYTELVQALSEFIPAIQVNATQIARLDCLLSFANVARENNYIRPVIEDNDVLDIRQILDAYGSDIKIIAKIENQEGVDNIDEILEVADGVMVARGDLGIEVPQERIPGIQRLLIKKCILAKKPVIVATQMLHTMINNPRPTRAEVTDIANAIYYRTDALMLSGETAYGKYPVEAVKTMAKIAAQAEKDKLAENDIRIPLDENSNDVTAFLAKQAVKATSKLNIRAIITDSFSGRTARNIAAFRGKYPVLAICYKEKTMRHLALSYGVEAIYMPEKANGQAYYFAALRKLLDDGVLSESDMVAYLSSGKQGTQTSFLEINVVGDVLKYAMDYVLPNRNRYL